MQVLLSLLAGALFGAGLMVSDMIDPARVRAFLDIASGAWDPTLAFVMGGAMVPMLIAWRVAARMRAPACGGGFPARPAGRIDARLLGGAALFGLGWGLVGFCPGPALAALTLGGWPVALFVVAMLTGMALHGVVEGRRAVSA
jgi:uncharacterized membrane protein YedE/YeeE